MYHAVTRAGVGAVVAMCLVARAQDTVIFADPNLETAVRSTLGVPSGPISPTHMLALTELNATTQNISSLSGLEYATNLTMLFLGSNRISDLTPIAGLTGLTTLNVGYNSIADITPLQGLTNLVALILSANDIANVAPLSDLTELNTLLLDNNNVGDVAPIAGLTKLALLFLSGNAIDDATPFAGLVNLSVLSLGFNNIGDVSPLGGLVGLTSLDLNGNRVTDLTPLSGLTALDTLSLTENQVSDVAPIAAFGNLSRLYLNGNNINDIAPLVANEGLGSGDILFLDDNPLNAVALCEHIPILESRNFNILTYDGECLAGVFFEDSELEAAVREALDIPSGPIDPIDLELLTRLNAAGRGIRSLTGLEGAVNLTALNLSYNRLESLDALLLNGGLGNGVRIELFGNPLDESTLCDDLEQLRQRGVEIGFNDVCGTAERGQISGFLRDADFPEVPVFCGAVIVSVDSGVMATAMMDANGYYQIGGLLQGVEYSLVFEAPGYESVAVDHILSGPMDEVSLDMTASPLPPALEGFVFDDTSEQRPVAAALVVASQGGRQLGRTATCFSGHFIDYDIEMPKQSLVMLEVSAPGYVPQTVEVDLEQSEELAITLPKLNLPGSIVGLVVDDDGGMLGNAQVVVQQVPGGFNAERTTAPDGGYSVASVPDGDYEARAVLKDVGWGLNDGSVNQGLEQIDIQLMTDGGTPCTSPSAPTGVSASDGTDTTAVVVMWETVAGAATEYRVFRATTASAGSAAPVSDWISSTTFEDTTALAPTVSSGGCNGGGTTTFHTYYYWVMAREAGDENCTSALSTNDTGYRGLDKELARAGMLDRDMAIFVLATVILFMMSFESTCGRNRTTRGR